MSSQNPVGVFVKSPRVGHVKTRLGESIGMRNAAEFYAVGLGWLFRRMHDSNLSFIIFFDPPDHEQRLRRMYRLDEDTTMVPQEGEDLGERMYNALCWMDEHSPGPPVIMGSDSPDLPTEWIKNAIDYLAEHRLVIGPARDGGYYLIGCRRPRRNLFEEIDWSTSGVLDQTLDKARSTGLSPRLLPEWQDIDTLEDLMARI